VVDLEEQHLSGLFPAFGAFSKAVPRLLPRLTPAANPGKPFRWATYWKNREYEALAGFLAGAVVLVAKALLF
jgi:hypothetical protein